MWWIILSVVAVIAWIGFCVYKARKGPYSDYEGWIVLGAFLGSLTLIVALLLLSFFLIPATTGLCEDYSQGELVGHVTEVAREGVIWKTTEVWIGLAAEPGLAYQKPLKVSVPDSALWGELAESIGQRVHLRYKGWVLMPFRLGATNYEIIEMR